MRESFVSQPSGVRTAGFVDSSEAVKKVGVLLWVEFGSNSKSSFEDGKLSG